MAAIGIFDSGSGGLSVFREIYRLFPEADYLYWSDNAFCPYGEKSREFITDRARRITSFLLSGGADIITVACNTATAASIGMLREEFPVDFIGMEPAVKPAALHTATGVIGVLATAGTLGGAKYIRTRQTYASGVRVVEHVGEGFVELVENGVLSGPEAERVVRASLSPLLDAGADVIVLGCTHYPYLINVLKKFAPEDLFINPAEYFAKAIAKDLKENNLLSGIKKHEPMFFVSSNPGQFKSASKLFYNVNKAEEISVNQLLVKYVRTKFHDKPTA